MRILIFFCWIYLEDEVFAQDITKCIRGKWLVYFWKMIISLPFEMNGASERPRVDVVVAMYLPTLQRFDYPDGTAAKDFLGNNRVLVEDRLRARNPPRACTRYSLPVVSTSDARCRIGVRSPIDDENIKYPLLRKMTWFSRRVYAWCIDNLWVDLYPPLFYLIMH